MLEKGLVQIYTGNGKGKTTAALGLALRAAGQGNRVLVYQFLKPPSLATGERLAAQALGDVIHIEALVGEWNMATSPHDPQAIARAQATIRDALRKIGEDAHRRAFDVIVLDEIVYCLSQDLARLEDVKHLIDQRDPAVEIVLTGRGATAELIDLADLVTEMKEIKHPFDKGVCARRGIEY
jgi:cob(I)alamin adenosyltransferase